MACHIEYTSKVSSECVLAYIINKFHLPYKANHVDGIQMFYHQCL